MVSIGCTICRGCQLDTCHVGIATQIEDMEEAEEKGLKKFTPQEFELAAENCARFFAGMGEEVSQIVADLGYERAQDLVGRSDLLVQSRAKETIDLGEMIRPLEEMLDLEPIDMPVSAEEEREAGGPDRRARPIRMEHQAGVARAGGAGGGGLRRADPHLLGGRTPSRARRSRPAASGSRARSRTSIRARSTPTTACSAPSLAGALSRARIYRPDDCPPATMDSVADLHFNGGSIGGSGLGAFNVWGVDIRVEGGAQDGVGKTMFGGTIAVMKGTQPPRAARQRLGRQVVRLRRPARTVLRAGLGRLALLHPAVGRRRRDRRRARGPDQDDLGGVADRANIKGFAFEYMTSGRAVVLGDIGPWACAGQTGGRVYMRVNDEWGLDREALERRLGKGAQVALEELDDQGVSDVRSCSATTPTSWSAPSRRRRRSAIRAIASQRPAALPDVGAAARADRPERFDRMS